MLSERIALRPPLRPRRTAAVRLREALIELAQGQARILGHSEKSWASATFAGTRHRLVLEFAGAAAIEAGELFIAVLPEHEFELAGLLVADATVTEVDHRLQPLLMRVVCELLLLEDG